MPLNLLVCFCTHKLRSDSRSRLMILWIWWSRWWWKVEAPLWIEADLHLLVSWGSDLNLEYFELKPAFWLWKQQPPSKATGCCHNIYLVPLQTAQHRKKKRGIHSLSDTFLEKLLYNTSRQLTTGASPCGNKSYLLQSASALPQNTAYALGSMQTHKQDTLWS